MIPDIEIWRSANELIKHYDDPADVEAVAWSDALLTKGDREGQCAGLRILKAIDALRSESPNDAQDARR